MTCTICGAENPETALICSSCRAFLQNRVRALDFFQTVWGVIEVPRPTFHAITIAEHKNYAFTLFALSGIPATGTLMSLFEMGDAIEGLMAAIAVTFVAGAFLGALSAPIAALAHSISSKVLRIDGVFRVSLGIIAYSLAPLAAVGLPVLIIQLMTFGQHYYTGNPSPWVINPVSAWSMAALLFAGAAWSFVLAIVGTRVGGRAGIVKSIFVVSFTAAIIATLWWWGAGTVAQALG